jgi:hypothetical protein
MRATIVWLVFGLCFPAPSLLAENAPGVGPSAELFRIEEELFEARKAFYLERDRLRAEIDQAARAAAMEAERRAAIEAEIKALSAELESLRARAAALAATRTAVIAALADLDRIAKAAENRHEHHIRNSFPFRREERLLRLRLPPEETADLSAPIFRARSVVFALDEEIAAGAKTEVAADEVALSDGRRKRARLLRLGALALFFVTDDAEEAGVFCRSANGDWAIEQDARRAPLQGILAAVEMADRRRSASFLFLPLDLARPRDGASH